MRSTHRDTPNQKKNHPKRTPEVKVMPVTSFSEPSVPFCIWGKNFSSYIKGGRFMGNLPQLTWVCEQLTWVVSRGAWGKYMGMVIGVIWQCWQEIDHAPSCPSCPSCPSRLKSLVMLGYGPKVPMRSTRCPWELPRYTPVSPWESPHPPPVVPCPSRGDPWQPANTPPSPPGSLPIPPPSLSW